MGQRSRPPAGHNTPDAYDEMEMDAGSASSPRSTPSQPAYSGSLSEDLGIYRTQMLQAAIGEDFASAFDLITYTLCMKQLRDVRGYITYPLNLTGERYRTTTALKDADATASGIQLVSQHAALSLAWMTATDDASRFAAFCALPEADKQKLFSYCVAENVNGGLSGRMHPVLEAVAARLNVQAHLHWRPTESGFFKRIKKPQILTLITEVIGATWCSKVADQTRGQIASWLGRVFALETSATSGMDAATLERISQWMPERMAYATAPGDATDLAPTIDATSATVVPLTVQASEETALPDWMRELDDAA